MPYKFAVHIDPFSSGTNPYGFVSDATSEADGIAEIDKAIGIMRSTGADLAYVDVSKGFIPPMVWAGFDHGGLFALINAGVPAICAMIEHLPRLTAVVDVLFYVGHAPGTWVPEEMARGHYELLKAKGVKYVAQDFSGTMKGPNVDAMLRYNQILPTLVEGPADPGPDGDRLLELGCVIGTTDWGRYERAQEHKGLRIAFCNAGVPVLWKTDPEVYSVFRTKPWEKVAPHWCDTMRGTSITPCLLPYSAPAGYQWGKVNGVSAAPAPPPGNV